MASIFQRIRTAVESNGVGSLIFATALVITSAIIAVPRGGSAAPRPHVDNSTRINTTAGGVTLSGSISQKKIVQGSDGVVYLELSIDNSDKAKTAADRSPVDMVVVLDRSGSMAAENRLPFAKSAINDLLSRLNKEDRFGLITFETGAAVVSELEAVTDEFRSREQRVVASLTPAGSTNMSAGLELAKSMVARASGRTRKVILLSDGEANLGVTDPSALASMAQSFGTNEAILSTIGMGLGFNEGLMASLADHGMGNYSFLESLAKLGDVLSKDLDSTRQVFASSSGLELQLPKGVRVVDSSGYPLDTTGDKVRILTGQLLSGIKKSLIVTLSAPTADIGMVALGGIHLNYTVDGKVGDVSLDGTELALEIVEPSRKPEAIASMDETLFRKAWAANNLGRMQQEFSAQMKVGNVTKAKDLLRSYRNEVDVASSSAGIANLMPAPAAAKLQAMEAVAADADSGSAEEKKTKQNRAAKSILSEARISQRGN